MFTEIQRLGWHTHTEIQRLKWQIHAETACAQSTQWCIIAFMASNAKITWLFWFAIFCATMDVITLFRAGAQLPKDYLKIKAADPDEQCEYFAPYGCGLAYQDCTSKFRDACFPFIAPNRSQP